MTAIFLFYIPFSFYHADVLANIAGVSERELRGLQKTTVFSDTNNVGTLNDRHFILHVTLHNTMLLLTTTTTTTSVLRTGCNAAHVQTAVQCMS
jgi:hypothetical protein